MSIKKRPISPRQKMINLMYVVLMAMLALNVSTDVLKGFDLVGEKFVAHYHKHRARKTSLFWLILNNNIVLIPPR